MKIFPAKLSKEQKCQLEEDAVQWGSEETKKYRDEVNRKIGPPMNGGK